MSFRKILPGVRTSVLWTLSLVAVTTVTAPTQAAFHLWNLKEVYSNASGTLQFVELFTTFSSQQFVASQQFNVSNVGNTMTNMFTMPSNLPADSANRHFLMGTAGIQAAGGPAPDFIIPDGFLFTAGGTINFFGANSGAYSALPIDGAMSRIWGGGNNPFNSPTNFGGQVGFVNGVPEPTTMVLTPLAIGLYGIYRRVSRRRATTAESEI